MTELEVLDGVVSGRIANSDQIRGTISPESSIIGGALGNWVPPAYDGAYEVTPLPSCEIILETLGKRLEDDLTIHEIPYYETTNESGGYTVIIG